MTFDNHENGVQVHLHPLNIILFYFKFRKNFIIIKLQYRQISGNIELTQLINLYFWIDFNFLDENDKKWPLWK